MKSQDIVILLKLILLHQSADEGDLLEEGKREAFSARGLNVRWESVKAKSTPPLIAVLTQAW